MLKRLLQVFSEPTTQVEATSEERIPLAAAVLLLEIANTDGEFHPDEQDMLGALLKEHFSVSEESLGDLLKLAEETRQSSHDLHQFTREINKAFTQGEKEQIIEALWQLVYADGRLDRYEDALMRQLGSLIGLSHRQLIEAKLRVTKD
ncbi:TerB family tellurite resistance protein [uncultured Desulfuromusa sp.]|uniref:tellurite resistance TerB family protein n=1 Tax=uncultured Desulfuromusa sp. TaxID=219183 RepID=UPI002AA7B96F|nr:TerB family tellurite resistance protein [uncultured Desulfuromusa sp.]